jgi:paraquat-inducible protein B
MKTKVRPAIVGAFVVGAFALGLIALLSFGSLNFLHKRTAFVVYFNESIQGLTLGSSVKMSGVTLGRVIDNHVRYDATTNKPTVEVVCEFDRNMIRDPKNRTVDVTSRAEVDKLIQSGLRAQLGVVGLATGLAYIELVFTDPKLYPADKTVESPEGYPVIPAVLSRTSVFSDSALEILTSIKRIDFQGISNNLLALTAEIRAAVKDVHEKLDQVDIKALADQWKATGASVETLANAPEIRHTFVTLDATLADVRKTVNGLNQQVDVNGQNLQATLQQAQATMKQFNAAAVTLQKFVAAQGGLGESATQAFNQLSAASDAVQRLADFIERNPSALISGKKQP